MLTIGIDFDGTICRKQSYGNGKIHEVPRKGSGKAIDKIKKKGFKIVIFTTRLNPCFGGDIKKKKERIENWLDKHQIPYDEVTNNKPPAMAYIDDRAIRFTNWEDVVNYFVQ